LQTKCPFPSEHLEEIYKRLGDLSIVALKTDLLLNGSAAIAALIFAGHLWSSGLSRETLPNLIYPMSLFIAGLVAAGLATVAGYLMQLDLYNEELKLAEQRSARRYHHAVLWAAISLVLASIALFAAGALADILALAPS
jgi:hypothetical protein